MHRSIKEAIDEIEAAQMTRGRIFVKLSKKFIIDVDAPNLIPERVIREGSWAIQSFEISWENPKDARKSLEKIIKNTKKKLDSLP